MANTEDKLEEIVLSPDPRLKTECAKVEVIDDSIRNLAARMLEDMYAAEGCGLAAPQVGELIQMVVIDVDYDDEGNTNPYVLINPVIVAADGEPRTFDEGCLSFPGLTVTIERPSHVIVRALNLEGKLMQYEAADNLLAVCLQHEIDHLHGVTMLDHVPASERVQLLKEYREALDAGAKPGDTAKSRK